jgi:hypothetical protein
LHRTWLKGGIVPATPGGRLAVIGEGGEDEAVIPLSKLGRWAAAAAARLRVVLDIGAGADTEFGRLLLKVLRTQPATAAGAARHLGVS